MKTYNSGVIYFLQKYLIGYLHFSTWFAFVLND